MNSSSSSPGSGPLIDYDQLQSACDGDVGLMRELMDLYFGQADQIMPKLQQAVQTGAVDDVDHLSHKLAGSSLACGMSAIVPPLRKMELGAKGGSLDGADACVVEAAATLEKLRQAVQEHIRKSSQPS